MELGGVTEKAEALHGSQQTLFASDPGRYQELRAPRQINTRLIVIEVPGEPVSQGRGRAFAFQRPDGSLGARIFDPPKSRNWKACAQQHMRDAMAGESMRTNPVRVEIQLYFSCPKSDWRQRVPMPERPHAKKPDAENCAKAVLDAGNGVCWADDSRVAELLIVKRIAAQGEPPRVRIEVSDVVA